MYQERTLKPCPRPGMPDWFRATAWLFDWKHALIGIQRQTLIRWQREGARLF